MSTDISLHELLDLSIGTPDVGSVNFSALHTLLHAILGHLKIERVTTTWKEADNDHDSPTQTKVLLLDKSSPYRVMEEKLRRMEEQMRALEALPSASELMSSDAPLSDMWTLMQLRGKAQANEDGVSKCMDLIQDLLKEVQALKESRDDLKQEVHALNGQLSQLNMNELADRIVAMEQYCHQVEDLDNTTKELKDKMAQYPVPEELQQCVTWEVMQAALISERQKIQGALPAGLQGTISTVPIHPLNLGSPIKDERAGSGGTAGVDLSHQVSPSHQSPSDGTMRTVTGSPLSRVSIGAERYPETVEALKEVGRLRDRHESLEVRMGQLEANKADQTQLQHLRDVLAAIEERQIPDHVPEQLNHLRTLVDSLLAEKEKLNSLRVMIEDMMSSSSSPLSKSEQQEAVEFSRAAEQAQSSGQDQVQSSGQSQSSGQDQGQQQTEGHDPGLEISQLSQCSYKAEDKTTHLTIQEHRGRNKNTDLASDVEGALLQLQADCERLHSTSRRLTEEHSEKQIHIDRLYKMLEELDEKKADKELVEMKIEIKADKRALEGKVSRMQFDSMTEQLNNMLQELLSKISGQEKDWNKVIEKISSEMDCKLNRIELDPLKKQLDDRWRTIHKHLQTPSLPEQDDAAGLRKQLVARFHCISCDRPVEMMTPGQHMVTLPSAPGLPSHKSNRPYSVYELEQMRQHCRSERIAEMADYSYLARSCGGSHTLTYPSRRYTRIQHITHLIHSDEESRPVPSGPPPQAEEANIMGLDGQVYKGRMNSRAVRLSETRLPTISPREGNWKSKDKVSRSQSQRSSGVDAGHGSAKTQRSRSASSISVRDRPLSSLDCLSQDVPLQSSFHDTTTERNKDLNQSEDEPVTSL
ncbi:glutamine-rich protein 2 isoform X4 [Chanodichthys erythropterus]|uniref:glutamine-rich protein 2 isoform X4 n=1 Tax=Chanodichthys erythropterus TaxID=933992 RepID=UPI00351F678F